LAVLLQDRFLDFPRASEEYERAVTLAPGHARALGNYGEFAVLMGRSVDAGIAATRRAAELDPLNPNSHDRVGFALQFARRYQEALTAYEDVVSLDPTSPRAHTRRGLTYYLLGNLQGALSSCKFQSEYWEARQCLAMTYHKLGRHADAEAQLALLKSTEADGAAFQYVEIYAQWGDEAKALEWLQTALRLRDPGLANLRADPFLDPLRQHLEFRAIERELKFPP
jgi:tetratricopeptide (TPR) repeat protein